MLAKGRPLGIQFQALFGDTDLFTALARHANAMAAELAEGIVAAGHELAARTQTNQVFPILPNSQIARLKDEFGFYVWSASGDAASVIRLVTSWATEERHVDAFLARLTAG